MSTFTNPPRVTPAAGRPAPAAPAAAPAPAPPTLPAPVDRFEAAQLLALRDSGRSVVVRLLDGTTVTGPLRGWSRYLLLVGTTLVYKHAAATLARYEP